MGDKALSGRRLATSVGLIAIVLWGLLALLTAASGNTPAFQLLAMTMGIGGLLGLAVNLWRKKAMAALRQPGIVWLVGVAGLFGYHFFYYTALRNAPPVEAGLIAYLWPLLIVLFSALLPGETLRWYHVAGAALGALGTVVIVWGGIGRGGDDGMSAPTGFVVGYGAALACALIWSSYSVVSRRFAHVPSGAIAGFCLVSALLSAVCHILFESTVWPQSGTEWAATLALGAGPVGLAFYVWDYGMKRGDIQVLGAAAYGAPLLSTLVLILFGFGQFTWGIGLACALITGGALLAAQDMLGRS